jgi:hypothetical protein
MTIFKILIYHPRTKIIISCWRGEGVEKGKKRRQRE